LRKALAIFVLFFTLALFAVAPARALVVFTDNFSGDLSNWTVMSGSWSIVGGELSQSEMSTYARIKINSLNLQDVSVEADLKYMDLFPNSWCYVSLAIRSLDENNFYSVGTLQQISDAEGLPTSNLLLLFQVCDQGEWKRLVTVDMGFVGQKDRFYSIKVNAEGNNFKIYVDGVLKIDTVDTTLSGPGGIFLFTYRCVGNFDNVIVTNPTSFNAVPEPAPAIALALSIAALTTYGLIRKRTGNKTIIKSPN